VAIENTAFTYPICEYYLIYNTSAPTTGDHISLISFAGVDNIFKYRYEPGDILIFQFRIYTSSYVNNQVTPTATIFYTVPAIDPILYDTDDLKNTALCNDFISFLTTQGIGCTLVPSGTYSYNGLSINHDAVGLNNQIWFDLTEAQIDSYIQSGEPFGKAGAYGIQGLGGAFSPSFKGSFRGFM
jgi:hypothetical protein